MQNEATAQNVVEFLKTVKAIPLWIDGGWGIDALLGKQTRPHSDLDIILSNQDLTRLRSALEGSGYTRDESREGLVYVSRGGLRVDVHTVRFDDQGFGIFDLPNGSEWPLDPTAFLGEGRIGSLKVRCLSPAAQVLCHAQGYEPSQKDIADMQALQRMFDVELPPALSTGGEQGGA